MVAIQNTFGKYRWESLGESFIALGCVLQQETIKVEEQIEEQAKEIYSSIYRQVCQFCDKAYRCWGEDVSSTIDALSSACNHLAKVGLSRESAFSIKFQGRCTYDRQLEIVLFNQIARNHELYQQQKQRDENKLMISQQLIMIGEQMKLQKNISERGKDYPEYLAVGYAGSKRETVSGDSWDVVDLQDGRLVQILCDGMGSGVLAMEQSNLAVQLLKTLLLGGLSVRLSLNIMNTVLFVQYGGVRFSTVDVAVWNLNTKQIEFYKYGAAPSFVCNGRQISTYMNESLPIGILTRVEGTAVEHMIQQGDLLIMMSDGLYELTNCQFQWENVICKLPTTNPQLMAEYLLAIATSRSRGNQKQAEEHDEKVLEADDMTILVSKLV